MSRETFTNGQLFNLQTALKELANVDVPARVGIKIARLIRTVAHEIDPITQVRDKLILKYGAKDEKGSMSVSSNSEHWDEFLAEINALMSQTTDVTFEKVALPEDVKVDVKTLVALEPFLTIEEAPAVNPNGVVKEIPVASI